MTTCTIDYYLEPLEGGRAQAMADLVGADGRVEASWPVGSPAPAETVAAAVAAWNGGTR